MSQNPTERPVNPNAADQAWSAANSAMNRVASLETEVGHLAGEYIRLTEEVMALTGTLNRLVEILKSGEEFPLDFTV